MVGKNMITLEELYKRKQETENSKILEKRKESQLGTECLKEESPKSDKWKPQEVKNFTLPEFKIPGKLTDKKQEMLSKILTFVNITQKRRLKCGCTAMPIPTTSKKNLLIWGNKMNVSRAIEQMENIGLITVLDETFRYGCKNKEQNYGKLYAYYKENEEKFIQYCKDNNIIRYDIYSPTEKEIKKRIKIKQEIEPIISFDKTKIRFGTNLKLTKPQGVSVANFEQFLKLCLYENYPEFGLIQTKIKEINEFYEEYPKFELSFEPSITWKENKVEKIGIRVSNPLCNMKKENRVEFLKQYGFNLEKDISGSVPRLTLSINSGHWIDESVNIYELISKEFEPEVEWNEARKEIVKYYILVSYFESGSDKMLGKNVTYNINKDGLDKTEVDELMGNFRKAMCNVLGGKLYGNEIFYIESCVYIMTVYDLLKSGIMVWLLYDAFYAKQIRCVDDEEEILEQETFVNMIEKGVAINLRYFMEYSKFRQECKEFFGKDLWGR